MNSMRSRVAEVLSKMGAGLNYSCEEIARAVITAMREPTLRQREHLEGKTGIAWLEGWAAMIDEALKER